MLVEPEHSVFVFFSYAKRDKMLRDRLEEHLSNLKYRGLITTWYDRQVFAGEDWLQQVDSALEKAQIILLLISSTFMASDYCYGKEMQQALQLHLQKKVEVIPILLRPVIFANAPFARFAMLPTNGRPITKWHDRDSAFVDVALGIERAAERYLYAKSAQRERFELVRKSESVMPGSTQPAQSAATSELAPAHFVQPPVLEAGKKTATSNSPQSENEPAKNTASVEAALPDPFHVPYIPPSWPDRNEGPTYRPTFLYPFSAGTRLPPSFYDPWANHPGESAEAVPGMKNPGANWIAPGIVNSYAHFPESNADLPASQIGPVTPQFDARELLPGTDPSYPPYVPSSGPNYPPSGPDPAFPSLPYAMHDSPNDSRPGYVHPLGAPNSDVSGRLPPITPPVKRSDARTVFVSLISLLIIAVGVFGLLLYNNHESIVYYDATVTAQALVRAKTQTTIGTTPTTRITPGGTPQPSVPSNSTPTFSALDFVIILITTLFNLILLIIILLIGWQGATARTNWQREMNVLRQAHEQAEGEVNRQVIASAMAESTIVQMETLLQAGEEERKLAYYIQNIAAYRFALKHNPTDGEAWLGLGNSLYALASYYEAFEAFERAIQYHPGPAAHAGAGNVCVKLEDYEQALIFYNRALDLDLDATLSYPDYILALQATGKFDEAVQAGERMLELGYDWV